MAQIISFNSRLVYGHVGAEGAGFVLRRLGHEVWQVPTVLYSNHPGHGDFKGGATPASEVSDLLQGANAHGLMDNAVAMMSGYLGEAAQARSIVRQHQRSAGMIYLCDPVMGDNGALYVAPEIAAAIRDILLPIANIITPNPFELGYLAGRPVEDLDEIMNAARRLTKKGPSLVICTSAQVIDNEITTLAVTPDAIFRVKNPQLAKVPHGTGDMFAALFLARYLELGDIAEALAKTIASLHGIIAATNAEIPGELAVVSAQDEIVNPSAEFEVQQIE